MPTLHRRVNLVVKPEQFELLTRAAKATGKSKAGLMMELFEEVAPILERIVVVTEAAEKAKQQATAGLSEAIEAAEAKILPHANRAIQQFDLLIADIDRASGRLPPGEGSQRPPRRTPGKPIATRAMKRPEKRKHGRKGK